MNTSAKRFSWLQFLGELLITFGVVCLLFAFYEAYWTNLEAQRNQAEAAQELEQRWENPRNRLNPVLGEAMARLYIPAFGPDYQFAIIEGTGEQELLAGPGHYEDSEMPGEPGNFAVAGHRVGKGAPFNDLGHLESCDAIIVETATTWEIYRILPMSLDPAVRADEAAPCLPPDIQQRVANGDYQHVQGRHITTPDDYNVVHALPGSDEEDPTPEMLPVITLTTCHPQFSNAERMIIHAVHVRSQDNSTVPHEMQEA
ncbi:MAG: class E sortase [Corynebacterium glucuronolyticum]|nr:class E sortase [Corynebacterium glucuronolyticum]MDD7586647.1 class E sortase [Mycobacteriaceae bacterium]MDY5835084.1 class E sortase [Corynebacterium glucuronolyticum]